MKGEHSCFYLKHNDKNEDKCSTDVFKEEFHMEYTRIQRKLCHRVSLNPYANLFPQFFTWYKNNSPATQKAGSQNIKERKIIKSLENWWLIHKALKNFLPGLHLQTFLKGKSWSYSKRLKPLVNWINQTKTKKLISNRSAQQMTTLTLVPL